IKVSAKRPGREPKGRPEEGGMAWRHCWYKDVLPFTALIAVECSIVGLNMLIKAASSKGLSNYVFSLYSSAIASLGLLPLLFIFRRSFRLKGPVYIAMFRPLSIAIAAFMSFIFLGDPLHIGWEDADEFVDRMSAKQPLSPPPIPGVVALTGLKTEKEREGGSGQLREMGWRAWWYKDVLPLAALIVVECSQVGLSTIYKAASLKGLSYYVFVFYSYAIGTLTLLVPVLFILRSNRAPVLPSSKFPLFSRICLLGLLGATGDIIGFKGLEYSSPTLSSAMGNLVPAFTFILALILRSSPFWYFALKFDRKQLNFLDGYKQPTSIMERLVLRSSSTQAKIMGTVVSISGALVVTLYKGPIVWPTPSGTQSISLHQSLASSHSNWVIGGLLLATDYVVWSILFVVQKQIMEMYPAELIVVFLFYATATIISAPVCFIAENNLSSWILGPDVKLAAVIYSVSGQPVIILKLKAKLLT
ncbi:hypothetical protein Tsubulata_047760, partial [Turnera subulata]